VYVKELYIQDNGPIEKLHLVLPFDPNGRPIPQVIVGRNGAGKTTLMSVLADALIEGAVKAFDDVIAGSNTMSHQWFRVVGGKTIRHGSSGSLALVKFEHNGSSLFFHEEGGTFSSPAPATPPVSFSSLGAGSKGGSHKGINLTDGSARDIYSKGPYVYFPTSRSEPPYWFNHGAVESNAFKLQDHFSNQLGRSIVVERSLDRFSQWVLTLLVEMRADFVMTPTVHGTASPVFMSDLATCLSAQQTWGALNNILQIIVSDNSARFVWIGRKSSKKLGIANSAGLAAQGLEALSGGQASLLSIFGTLLQYGDSGNTAPTVPDMVEGICLIDEVDAHMHVDLLADSLPSLMKLFPKVQFIVSSHSPFLGIGLEKHLSSTGVSIIDLPSGKPIAAEAYHDFQHALDTFRSTKAFGDLLSEASQQTGKPLVWLAGETDPLYLRSAVAILDHPIKDAVDFEWIGAKDQSGQGYNTGDDALNKAVSLFSSNPDIVTKKIIILYDFDANKPDNDIGQLYIRSLNFNEKNGIAKKGVENLLPESLFTDDVYDTSVREKDYGGKIESKILNKMKLCNKVCNDIKSVDTFQGFTFVLDKIRDLVC
jgi:energy-coupling factor transporter ATP-binding protein EcfA2